MVPRQYFLPGFSYSLIGTNEPELRGLQTHQEKRGKPGHCLSKHKLPAWRIRSIGLRPGDKAVSWTTGLSHLMKVGRTFTASCRDRHHHSRKLVCPVTSAGRRQPDLAGIRPAMPND